MKIRLQPEQIIIGVTAALMLSALCCMIIGHLTDYKLAVSIGFWLGIVGIAIAFLPLLLFLVVLIVEKIRS